MSLIIVNVTSPQVLLTSRLDLDAAGSRSPPMGSPRSPISQRTRAGGEYFDVAATAPESNGYLDVAGAPAAPVDADGYAVVDPDILQRRRGNGGTSSISRRYSTYDLTGANQIGKGKV